jgi:molybdopterin-guanine dinucleotide biosynthesis protein A
MTSSVEALVEPVDTIPLKPLSAAVLAGGKSRRMGRDKALLPITPGGPPMLAIVLKRLATIADDLMVIANDAPRYESFGARVVSDQREGGGSLIGIHSALGHARYEHCLVVACDMPFLSLPLLSRMAAEPRDFDVLVPLLPGESRQGGDGLVYQTLHAIYSKNSLAAIEARLDRQTRQVIAFFPDVRVRALSHDEVARWDPELRSFFNANTPEALELAGAMAKDTERPRRS